MKFGIIGSGSWATGLVKMLNDNKVPVHWWFRKEKNATFLMKQKHNGDYLSTVSFNTKYIKATSDVKEVIEKSDVLLFVIPSTHVITPIEGLAKNIFKDKKIISAVKGILPDKNILLNEYLEKEFNIPLQNYFSIMGPCHAEEVAIKKLSYLTFSGMDVAFTKKIATHFSTPYVNTLINDDIWGVQYSAILKNIYAVGAGIAHGLRFKYGDNFLSVYNANCTRELAIFLNKFYDQNKIKKIYNHNDSVYLGDLLVTCYSPHSRNREFGTLIGKGYSAREAQLEMNMVAEGYNTSRCIFTLNKKLKAPIPIVENIFQIVWNGLSPAKGFKNIEKILL